ncbi:hypothetical protein BJ875DRAFT_470346 [Amylocarpus encephaloides]|uniref:Secreted protein n=1 Tax=Amylocarpus encephaloides TaxID=45428 RepID=A0A9P8C2K3_9HELO|nr:hypothetical protein BJ875DRAFT_470346 [Amylocarpus encephaloides]
MPTAGQVYIRRLVVLCYIIATTSSLEPSGQEDQENTVQVNKHSPELNTTVSAEGREWSIHGLARYSRTSERVADILNGRVDQSKSEEDESIGMWNLRGKWCCDGCYCVSLQLNMSQDKLAMKKRITRTSLHLESRRL